MIACKNQQNSMTVKLLSANALTDDEDDPSQSKLNDEPRIEILRAQPDGWRGRWISFYLKYRGIMFALFSAFAIAMSSVLIKSVRMFTGSDITLTRYTLQFIVMFIMIKRKNLSFLGPKDLRFSLSMRGIFGVLSLISMHFAVKFVDPSDSQALYNCSILFTAIIARVFLNEKLNFGHFVSLVMTIAGIILISQPEVLFKNLHMNENVRQSLSTGVNRTHALKLAALKSEEANSNKLVGIGLSLAGAGSAAIVPVIIKYLSNNSVPHSIMIIYASYFGIPASLFISSILLVCNDTIAERAKFNKTSYDLPLDLLFVFMASTLGLISQIGWNLAIKYEDASRSTVIRSLNIVFVFFLQYLFLDIKSNVYTVIGSVAILFGTIYIILFKVFEEKYSKQKMQI